MTYYDSIDKCTLNVFRDVLINRDYKQLLISGEYDEEQASLAWLKIHDEYEKALISKSANMMFEYSKNIEALKIEHDLLRNCLFLISECTINNLLNKDDKDYAAIDIDKYIKIVNSFNYRFEKSKGITSEVQRVSNQLKNYNSRITSIYKKVEKYNNDSGDWTFDDTIEVVEQHRKIAFDENTTVRKFVTAQNSIIRANKAAKESNKNNSHAK